MLETEYWAAASREDIGDKLVSRVEKYGTSQLTKSVSERHGREYQYYFGLDPSGVHATSQVLRKGEQGELAAVRVNHARPLVNALLNLIVAQKLVWQPKATNIDYDSIRECEFAADILEYYWSQKGVSKYVTRALEECLVHGEGFVLAGWDSSKGDTYAGVPVEQPPAMPAEMPSDMGLSADVSPDVEMGGMPPESLPNPAAPGAPSADLFAGAKELKTGDIAYYNVSTWDVIRDASKQTWEELDWVIVVRRENKYNVIARYSSGDLEGDGEAQERILEASDAIGDEEVERASDDEEESDDICVYHFYHKKTAAIPEGRQVVFVSNGYILEDSELQYDEIPLYRVAAAEIFGTPFGYTPFLDILGIQELMDSLHTVIATNQSTLGTNLVAMEIGSEIDVDNIGKAITAVYYPVGGKMPQGIALANTPREIFAYIDTLKNQQQQIIGLNSAVRGEAQSGEMSGSALALLAAQALQQSSVTQANWLRMVRELGMCTIAIFQRYATMPMKVALVGKGNTSLLSEQEISGDALSRIKRVDVDIGNPLSQSVAGRSEMAKDMMNLGLVRTPEQYQQVITTGRLDPLTKSTSQELMLIVSENEQLRKGESPPVVDVDDHLLHAKEHRACLADPEVRKNEKLVVAILGHIQDHQEAFFNTDPNLLMMVGQQPPMQPAPPPGGPGGPGGAPPPEGGPGGPGGPPPPSPGAPPEDMPNMPNLPQNPLTGQQWDPTTGGGVVPPK